MKYNLDVIADAIASPAPQGAGGLKLVYCASADDSGVQSRPARGGWIEISPAGFTYNYVEVPPRKGRVD